MKVTIIGAGSAYTPGIIKSIYQKKDRLPVKTICLYDDDDDRNNRMHAILLEIFRQEKIDISLEKTENLTLALRHTQFIFCQIRVGGLEMRSKDEKIPLKYGLVGQETCGLGGFAYGLRTIGPFLKIMKEVEKISPNAWVMNYTNPETLLAEATYRLFPNLNIINACDMTIVLENVIAQNMGLNRDDWLVKYYGLNHFGWYESIYDTNIDKDITKEIIEFIQTKGLDYGKVGGKDNSWKLTFSNMTKMLKLFPSSIPNNYLEYYFLKEIVLDNSSLNKTRADEVKEGREANIENIYKNILKKNESDSLSVIGEHTESHGDHIVEMACSIHNDERRRFPVIVRNNGSIVNFRSDAMIEIPGYLTRKGVEPIALKNPIPEFHRGLMSAQVSSEKLLVDSFFEGSYEKALQAFSLNLTVDSAQKAKNILDEMIEENEGYWPELK